MRSRVLRKGTAADEATGRCPSLRASADSAGGNKPVRLVGKITRVEWTNPHSYLYLDVTDAKGNTTNWGAEGAGPGALTRRGWKKTDLKIGDTIVIDGYRAKDGSHLIDARRVTLPDGRSIYGGTPGDGGPGDNGTPEGAASASAPTKK